jgi:hypothetical protein
MIATTGKKENRVEGNRVLGVSVKATKKNENGLDDIDLWAIGVGIFETNFNKMRLVRFKPRRKKTGNILKRL